MNVQKGGYGYRNAYKKKQILLILIGSLAIILQLLIRNFTDNQSAKNILTVMAILSVLPTANLLSPLLATWKYKTSSAEFYHQAKGYETRVYLLYDLIITSRELIIPFDGIAITSKYVYAYCSSKKPDQQKIKKFIGDMFHGHEIDQNFKLYYDESEWMHQLKLIPDFNDNDVEKIQKCALLLKSISV